MSSHLYHDVGQFLLSVFPDDVAFIWPNIDRPEMHNQPFISVVIHQSAYGKGITSIIKGALILTISQPAGTGTSHHQDMLDVIRRKLCFARTDKLIFADRTLDSPFVSDGFFHQPVSISFFQFASSDNDGVS